MKNYKHLFSPFQLKHLTLANRLVKAAQWTVFANEEGEVTDQLIDFYENLAKGGVGLITVEESVCDYPLGASNKRHLRLDEDRFIPGLKELAASIDKHGVPAIVQITHAGPAHAPFDGSEPVAPSRLDPPVEPPFGISNELTLHQIEELIEKFAQAAVRVQKAGFEGVEIHMAHYALINAFLSRVQNKRTDQFGGDSLANRARFSVSVLERVRTLCGDDFIIGVRMNGREWGHKDGTTLEEAASFAKLFEEAGADYLQVSSYGYREYALCALPDLIGYPEVTPEVKDFYESIPKGALIEDASFIRKQVNIPVSGVGHIEFESAEKIISDDQVDLVCMGRPFIVDPHFPNKLKGTNEETIRECLRCNVCLSNILLGLPVECRMNPYVGHESEMTIEPVTQSKRVMIVGAGPAGLEAARVLALRGHKPEIYDKSRDIGGLIPMAAFIKGVGLSDNVLKVIRYYEKELERLQVPIHFNKEVDADFIEKIQPEEVVLAVGGKSHLPEIEGIEKDLVVSIDSMKKQAGQFLHFLGSKAMSSLTKIFLPMGKSVIVIGDDYTALEAAEFLVKRGRKVSLVTTSEQIGNGMPLAWLVRLMPWLAAKGVATYTSVQSLKITDDGVAFITSDDQSKELKADSVMAMSQYDANHELQESLNGSIDGVHCIGDAAGDGLPSIQKSIREGARVGLAI